MSGRAFNRPECFIWMNVNEVSMSISRRNLLHTGSAFVVLTLAGCSGKTEELQTGETLTVEGIKVTVDDFVTEEKLIETEDGDTHTPTAGSIYFLAHVVFTNESDTPYELPPSPRLELIYSGEESPAADIFAKTGGENGPYESYRDTYSDAEAVFPGNSFSAWMIYLVPENFNKSKAKLRIDIEVSNEDVTGIWNFDGG